MQMLYKLIILCWGKNILDNFFNLGQQSITIRESVNITHYFFQTADGKLPKNQTLNLY